MCNWIQQLGLAGGGGGRAMLISASDFPARTRGVVVVVASLPFSSLSFFLPFLITHPALLCCSRIKYVVLGLHVGV